MDRLIAVCGPTASGKSDLSDELADLLTERSGVWTPTIAVDSMQVYREIPEISNQKRRRPAELVAVTSVTREWNVARHREAADGIISGTASKTCLLDAGTGMYLNALITDMELAPRVHADTRRAAEETVLGREVSGNRRRQTRELELKLAGAGRRASIWDAEPRFETDLIFLRPPVDVLSKAIQERTKRILSLGTPEILHLQNMARAGNPATTQVQNAIGVKEISQYLEGTLSESAAGERITIRTRALAKRQIRWFDKLARTLEPKPGVRVFARESPKDLKHDMRDIVG